MLKTLSSLPALRRQRHCGHCIKLVLAWALAPFLAFAEEGPDGALAGPAFKFTATGHGLSESGNGLDLNLRHTSAWGNTWLGYFNAGGLAADQARMGWDSAFSLSGGGGGNSLRVLPSLQAAAGGFVGGSLGVEIGTSGPGSAWAVNAGVGRTNQRPYFNLNFDPNDALTWGASYRGERGENYALSVTRDNRDNPDQQHVHLIYRQPVGGSDRLTLDVLLKTGMVNGNPVDKVGATVTYDWPRHFVRLAYDPNTNFTPDNALRLSVGTRF